MCICLDCLDIAARVKLVKIDTEGHILPIIEGMRKLMVRDHPTLIIATDSSEVEEQLGRIGYVAERLKNSPSTIFRHKLRL